MPEDHPLPHPAIQLAPYQPGASPDFFSPALNYWLIMALPITAPFLPGATPQPPTKKQSSRKFLPLPLNTFNVQGAGVFLILEKMFSLRPLPSRPRVAKFFNTAKNWDFLPEINVDGINLEVVEEYKLLGVMITSDLKWDTNTEHITKKAFSRLWMIRRLKNLGLNTESLLQIFRTQVRSLLEYGAVTWHSMLTDENSKSIERVQKSALSIILGPDYICYENALERTKLERLDQRRIKLSLSFAKKAVKHPQHSSWFNLEQTDKQIHTRSVKPLCKPVQARTQRLSKSPIVFLTNLLNVDHAK